MLDMMEKKKHTPKNDTAVALKYEAGVDVAPKVVAKGRRYLAEKIIEVARANKVPLYADAGLAQALYEVNLDRVVPEELYQLVAEVLAWVWTVDASYREKSGGRQ
jgi:FlhB-like protein